VITKAARFGARGHIWRSREKSFRRKGRPPEDPSANRRLVPRIAEAWRTLAEACAKMSRKTPRAIMDEWLAAIAERERVKARFNDLRRRLQGTPSPRPRCLPCLPPRRTDAVGLFFSTDVPPCSRHTAGRLCCCAAASEEHRCDQPGERSCPSPARLIASFIAVRVSVVRWKGVAFPRPASLRPDEQMPSGLFPGSVPACVAPAHTCGATRRPIP
jgi:hypothetical protein